MTLNELKDKKIAVVGFGVNNRKLVDFLGKHGIAYEIIDGWHSPDELIGRLDEFEVIFRTPGLPYLSKAVQHAKAKGSLILSQTKLFFSLCTASIIGVTGTKGKGTTISLLADMLKLAGNRVFLGGNIGRDPFEFIDILTPDSWVILELSSFQLQDLESSPHIAVVLNITSDHLNHHRSVEEYLGAKLPIVTYQRPEDYAVLDHRLPDNFKHSGNGRKIFFDPQKVGNWERKLIGQHNLENISAAFEAAKLIGVSEETAKLAVKDFEPLPHRLRVLGTFEGIRYIDDAFSTNVDPTMAAIDAMTSPTVLIVGGYDKGLDFKTLGKKIVASPNIKALVIIGRVTEKILQAVDGFKGEKITGGADLEEVISQARSLVSQGDTILFSPGTSSFDMFKNEVDRGEQFLKLVNELK
ncbi:MAG: UDP-N-acetylmuramoylalanine--D-glutamate ligase [Candidatus Doudnabacteria bacterium RIFCSPLOWO2_02_FULL_48_8]|uniref:UDP-N-acetylmuramoylalanine--D-glutamate ligase n=1 Tax=Candidatus Doudnabacteria bacterium RIFCSPHIGHO2_01_FULL_46_24 TaxID=1817825 RepID=A0A1F5NUL8_9BACT|nr:MAG: UDP-N-acetylmuramoylalanine--D-glutamate ligase [Candidatus Doudnabacteria bacterium RIFCSPHIGHO2_01_FULL_46_24]OGE95120.1 MAG: UDP-N-acetylmuramoylalanine--D-glutamate ligase [Candidatus Doudnabacteria bacterium RIFCSPLOWO2_02_FULL_48_8]